MLGVVFRAQDDIFKRMHRQYEEEMRRVERIKSERKYNRPVNLNAARSVSTFPFLSHHFYWSDVLLSEDR